jgi:hypothetical protein
MALLLVASLVAAATHALALELGPVQAVPSQAPPHIFRLPLLAPLPGASDSAAVTVRQPPDTLAFVKQHVVEIRLRALADVELEVSYGGEILNRLVPKRELQAAQLRLEMVPAANLALPAKAKSRDRPSPEVRTRAEAAAAHRSLIEAELEGLRQEVHRLVEHVAPWPGSAGPAEAGAADRLTAGLTLGLGGCALVAVVCLTMAAIMPQRAMARQRLRQEALATSIQRLRTQLALEAPRRPTRLSAPPLRALTTASVPVPRRRRVRVTRTTRRRFRVWAAGPGDNLWQAPEATPHGPPARMARHMPSAAAELLEALARLRGELMRLQGGSPPSARTD